MDIIFLSAHLDDAVYSCGGLIHKMTQAGHSVQVRTFFTGDPEIATLSPFARELHARWGVEAGPMSLRRIEDQKACSHLGASTVHYDFQDCAYRIDSDSHEHMYPDRESLFGDKLAADDGLIEEISAIIHELADGETRLFAPLTHGNHIDHQVLRAAADKFDEMEYYFDLPYGLKTKEIPADLISPRMEITCHPLSEENLERWAVGCELYTSQFNDYWASAKQLRRQLRKYNLRFNGFQTWKR